MTISSRIDKKANAALLIQQWKTAPRMRALTEALLEVVDAHLVQPLVELERQTTIQGAEAAQLDAVGERLDQSRPAVVVTSLTFPLFGFDGSGAVGFDQGPFGSSIPNLSPRVPVGDSFYRALLGLRSRVLLSDGSTSALDGAIQQSVEDAEYQDNGDMTGTLHLPDAASSQLVDMLRSLKVWPKPAGVSLGPQSLFEEDSS